MTNISTIARPRILAPLLVDHPEEFDPVELLWIMQREEGWTAEQFATVFGCSLHNVYKWSQTRKCGRLARIRAATLKKQWGF